MSLPDAFLEMVTRFGLIPEGEDNYEDDGMMVNVKTHSLTKGAEKFVSVVSVWPNGFQHLSIKRFKNEQFKEALWVETEEDIKSASKRLGKLLS